MNVLEALHVPALDGLFNQIGLVAVNPIDEFNGFSDFPALVGIDDNADLVAELLLYRNHTFDFIRNGKRAHLDHKTAAACFHLRLDGGNGLIGRAAADPEKKRQRGVSPSAYQRMNRKIVGLADKIIKRHVDSTSCR